MVSEKLRYPYIAVNKDGKLHYGGSQSWSMSKIMQKYGCGVIAGTDLLLYLDLHKTYCRGMEAETEAYENGALKEEEYLHLVQKMRVRYFPLIPGFGMPGWLLALGINFYFLKNRIPLWASFGVTGKNIFQRIQGMLAHDIPVILAIGPNFPLPLKKHKLTFYRKSGDTYREACKTAAHYVTVTGMDDMWLRISSWGQEYYVNKKEYLDYVKRHSSFLVSNICFIRKNVFVRKTFVLRKKIDK